MALADLELFADVDAQTRAALEARLERLTVEAGQVLLREGEPGDCFLLIVDGEASVTRDGKTVGVVGRGSIVGEQALLRDHRRSATVTATVPLVALAGGVEEFAAL